ncbi:MAG TPA: hypothetical protein VGR74_05885 [Actinomycetota bacterium]|jgi:hypothetical protein|nr:hypothetical protein [Actinomycetota bacterium]
MRGRNTKPPGAADRAILRGLMIAGAVDRASALPLDAPAERLAARGWVIREAGARWWISEAGQEVLAAHDAIERPVGRARDRARLAARAAEVGL